MSSSTPSLRDWHKQRHQLRDDVFKDVVRMMLFVSVERGDSRGIVRFFEELKDRYEDLVIPFDKVVAVHGKAYLDLGEFERALMVFQGHRGRFVPQGGRGREDLGGPGAR